MSNAIDGTERWWQSPPLSRGLVHNEVNVTLDLGQVRCSHLSLLRAAAREGRGGRNAALAGVAFGTPRTRMTPIYSWSRITLGGDGHVNNAPQQ